MDATIARMLAGLLVLVAGVVAAAMWVLGGPGLADLLADDAPLYAAAILWVCVAPLVLLVALVATIRTPWPWVVVAGVHLVVLTATVARLRNLVPGSIWIGVVGTVVLGIASAAAVVHPGARPNRTARTAQRY